MWSDKVKTIIHISYLPVQISAHSIMIGKALISLTILFSIEKKMFPMFVQKGDIKDVSYSLYNLGSNFKS